MNEANKQRNDQNMPGMERLDIAGGYLPSYICEEVELKSWHYCHDGKNVTISVPWLTPDQLEALTEQLQAKQRQYLSNLSVDYIVEVIAAAIERMLDRQDSLRKRAEQL